LESSGHEAKRAVTTTNYPNGQRLISSALTVAQINTLMQSWTCGALGINPVDPTQVRYDWPTQGQPFQTVNQDICYLSCLLQDSQYSRVRNKTYTGSGPVVENWTYTRNWRISWTLYGPNSLDRARAIHTATFIDYFNDLLNGSSLFPISEPAEPVRMPENFNAQWWERVDFSIDTYENVTETISDGVVTSVEIKVYDGSPNDPVADFTVT
jgi:hypothetical protein